MYFVGYDIGVSVNKIKYIVKFKKGLGFLYRLYLYKKELVRFFFEKILLRYYEICIMYFIKKLIIIFL